MHYVYCSFLGPISYPRWCLALLHIFLTSGSPNIQDNLTNQPDQVREDQDHLTQCQGYSDLLTGVDLESDMELVNFYKRVMARREKEGWN